MGSWGLTYTTTAVRQARSRRQPLLWTRLCWCSQRPQGTPNSLATLSFSFFFFYCQAREAPLGLVNWSHTIPAAHLLHFYPWCVWGPEQDNTICPCFVCTGPKVLEKAILGSHLHCIHGLPQHHIRQYQLHKNSVLETQNQLFTHGSPYTVCKNEYTGYSELCMNIFIRHWEYRNRLRSRKSSQLILE